MSSRRIEDVWLSDLRFADLKPNQQPQANRTEGAPNKSSEATSQESASSSKTFPRHSDAKAYDRLAADKPGEELTPEATIWKLYVAEAEEFDGELVEREHRNIDVMLVFAALFSAILTAFLLDSKKLMLPDPADATNLLLTRIAQRLEDPGAVSQPAEIPAFEPTTAARWINGLWFASLGLSLAAALLAMMAKEWLTTFAASRPRPAHSYAIERQARLDALSSWGALQMIDHLPLFLHVALFLFSLGLVVYLYTSVDLIVTSIIALITGVVILFYIIATGLAALYEVCPFDTQLSYYCRRMLRHISHHWKLARHYRHYFNIKRPESWDYTTKEDLHALQWLANHARDPRVSDSAYQSLAGLRLKPQQEQSAAASAPNLSLLAQSGNHKKSGRKDRLVTSMFVDVCHRLHQARSGSPHELAVSFGVNVARYASTLPHFVNHLVSHSNQERLAKLVWARMAKIGAGFAGVQTETFDPSRVALNALDSILQDDYPPFTADAYTWITTAELKLTTSIARAIKGHEDDVSSKAEDTGEALPESIPAEAVTIDARYRPAIEVTLFDLRARYSRALARASIQIVFHSDCRAPMNAFSLIPLLEAIRDAAQCSALNPSTSLSTHHPQDSKNASILPNFAVLLIGTASSYFLTSGEIGDPDGLLGGILNILGSSGIYPVAGVESIAGSALQVLAPMLIRQWLNLPTASTLVESQDSDEETKKAASFDLRPHNSDPPRPYSEPSPISLSLDSWPSAASLDTDDITTWVLSQLLYLAAFAKLHYNGPGIGQLLELSLRAFNNRSKHCYPRGLSVWSAEQSSDIVRYLATTSDVEPTPPKDLDSISDYLLRLLAFKDEDCSIFTVTETSPSDLFRIIQSATTCIGLVESLLVDISKHGSQDLLHFTKTDRGFHWLFEIAERSEYIPAVALCVFDLVTKSATPLLHRPSEGDQQSPVLVEDDVEAFLKAVTIVLNHPPPNGKRAPNLSLFLSNLFSMLESLQGEEMAKIVFRYLPRKEIENAVQSNLAKGDSKLVVSAGLEKYKVGGNAVAGA